jgi:hypothetical protein
MNCLQLNPTCCQPQSSGKRPVDELASRRPGSGLPERSSTSIGAPLWLQHPLRDASTADSSGIRIRATNSLPEQSLWARRLNNPRMTNLCRALTQPQRPICLLGTRACQLGDNPLNMHLTFAGPMAKPLHMAGQGFGALSGMAPANLHTHPSQTHYHHSQTEHETSTQHFST